MKKTCMYLLAGFLLAVGTPATAQSLLANGGDSVGAGDGGDDVTIGSDIPGVGQTVEITYTYYYDGVEQYSETLTATEGEAYPEPTTLPDFVAYTLPEGTVTSEGGTYTVNCTLSTDNPFSVSSNYDSEDVAWYALTLSSSYYFVGNPGDDATYIPLNVMTLIPTSMDELDDYLWCFVGNPFDGYRLYNYTAGGKFLAAPTDVNDNNTGGNTFPRLYDKNDLPEGYNTTWDVVSSSNLSGKNGFYLVQHGYSSDSHAMNMRANCVAFWTNGADAGSTFVAYDAQALYEQQGIADLFATTAEVEGAVGTYTDGISTGDYQTYLSKFDNNEGTWADYVTLCAASYNVGTGTRVEIDPTKFYRIQNYDDDATGGNLEVVDSLEHSDWSGAMVANNVDDAANSRATALWQFVSTGTDGGYYLYNLNSGKYIGNDTINLHYYLGTTSDIEEAGVFTVTSYATGQSLLVCTQKNSQLYASGNADTTPAGIQLSNGGTNSASAWYITEAETLDLTVSAAGWATANYPFAVQLPDDGLTAYTVTSKSDDGSTVYLTEVEGKTIPANTPVLLEGGADTYTLTLLPGNTDAAPSTNLLSGTTMYKTLAADKEAYVLAKPEGYEVGFYIVDSNDRTVKANRAYYVVDEATSGSNALRFSFGDAGTTTGISTATSEATDGAKVYYDLNGRRVLYPSRGIYVTADGRKVFIK